MTGSNKNKLLEHSLNRRRLLQLGIPGLSSFLLSGSPLAALMGCKQPAENKGDKKSATGNQERKFLFVFGAMGGASINDSFMARRESEVSNPNKLNVFPDSLVKSVEGTELRAVDIAMSEIGPLPFPVKGVQSRFLDKYWNDIMVAAVTGTTVSHPSGQYRSITGNGAWNNRTLQEAVAARYGKDLLLPNVNMATVGFAEPGKDFTLPLFARAEAVPDPAFFPFSLHGFKGIQGAPDTKLIQMARQVRDNHLEPESKFMQSYGRSTQLLEWLAIRKKQASFEERNLINELNAFEDSKDFPFKNFGLIPNKDAEILRDVFPDLGADPLQTQALLAYLLVTQGLSCTVSFGLGMNVTIDGSDADNLLLTNTPTAFDYSHNAHRATQALLWHRILDTLDRLITLLKSTEYGNGQSYWDHSMIYIATEFGRDKTRIEGAKEFTSGHHVNNGVTIISPMANGGKVLGAIDPKTLYAHGFNGETGEPQQGADMSESHIYGGILHALGVDTEGSGLPSMRAMRKKS